VLRSFPAISFLHPVIRFDFCTNDAEPTLQGSRNLQFSLLAPFYANLPTLPFLRSCAPSRESILTEFLWTHRFPNERSFLKVRLSVDRRLHLPINFYRNDNPAERLRRFISG